MNPIEELYQYLRNKHPRATSEITPPLHADGIWSIDITFAGKHLIVEWSPTTGFGISSASNENFGEGPDEVLNSLEDAQKRVDQLLTTPERSSPALPVLLSRLREQRGITQQELALRLGVRQATISGLERRRDVQLSTLRRVVEALGGMLEIFGVFPECRYRIDVDPSGSEQTVSALHTVPALHAIRIRQRISREAVFPGLNEAGVLEQAFLVGTAISSRRAVIEVP
jgi:transcriptional regulator with XRE-family HTH domain